MPRITKDAEGYWYCDGERIDVGTGKIEWDEGSVEKVLFTDVPVTIRHPDTGEEITRMGDLEINVDRNTAVVSGWKTTVQVHFHPDAGPI